MGNLRHPSEVTFCGYRAIQAWEDFYLWELLLNDNPQLEAIVELGTAYGGFALYLATQAEHRGLRFATFDRVDPRVDAPSEMWGSPSRPPRFPPLGDAFHAEDVLRGTKAVEDAIGKQPVVLLCDNGNKPREVALYAPLLPTGSLCVVHDWRVEIGPKDIPDCLGERYGVVCDRIGSWSRVFARV